MHEFALAQDIITTISEKVTDNFEKIFAINIEVGAFSGVVVESLDLGLRLILKEKNHQEIKININQIPTIALCECGRKYEIKDIFENCLECNSYYRKIISGKDIMINSVELKEDQKNTGGNHQ